MDKPRFTWVVWAGVALTAATLLVAFSMERLGSRTGTDKPLPNYGQIGDFALTDQNGSPVSLANLRGHAWVADIIFTRCSGPCLKMTRQMEALAQALPASSHAKLVTLTTDPDYDTSSILKTYAQRVGADFNRWMFLTGPKKQIAALAIDSLKLTAIEKKPEERQTPEDLFVHSTIFVVADKQGRLRGVFQTTGEGVDPEHVKQQLLDAVSQLERE
jgi:protein SCO1